MSIDQPIYGVDISDFQRGIDLAQVAREGYEFCVVKASEGPYGDGTFYLNPSYGPQIDAARRAGLLAGAYHFLVETPARAQVDLFLNTVGDVSGKLVMVDYEAYPNPFQFLSPTMATLRAFVTELKKRIGEHPILVYAGQGYWNEPPPNGSIRDLGVTIWDAFYPLHPLAGFGSVLYEQVKHLGWGKRWGDQEPKFWQFSANGRVAGMQIDVNALNTYVDHPETFGRDMDSFDVWGLGGRNDPVGFDLGQRVFEFVFNDPNPPLIEWCIWRRAMWTRASGQFEPFGVDDFSFHDDHSHWTFVR